MKNKTLLIVGLIVIIFFGIVIGNLKQKPSEEIKVGVILPLSDEVAVIGEKVKNGIELAISDSEIYGEIKFIYEDGGIEPKKGLTAYQKLTSLDGVEIFIGPFGPDQILSVAPNLKEDDILIGLSLCEDRFKKYPQIFCTYPSNSDQVRSAIPVIKENNVTKLGFITENSELGDLIESELKKIENEAQYKLQIVEKMKRGEKDFRTLIAKMKNAGIDGFYIASMPDEGYLILKQLQELGFSGTKLAQFDAVEEILKDLGQAAEGVFLPGHISTNFEKSFVANYKNKYGSEPDLYGALGHSIAKILITTLENNNFRKIKSNELVRVKNQTAIIDFEFKNDHTVSIPVESLIFKDGKIQQLDI